MGDVTCGSCGTHLTATAKFCIECGTPVAKSSQAAEYKQVTVLFADVVHSMDLAAAVGAERLREIMTDLVERAAAVVKRYDGTVDKFTGDGLMAVFGAPVALEDHAVRACLAALGLQDEAKLLAADVRERDGVDLQLRVGLNSGQVIAGEIGSGAFGYTAMGEQVGMAQRMEAAAPPGGVMLSASTARLVEHAAALGDTELVQIKGADGPVPCRLLLGMARQDRGRDESAFVGRRWEMSAIEALLDGAVDGHGAVVSLVGPPGIGKSRTVREVAAIAARRGVDVFRSFCESHTKHVPFHTITQLLRAATGVEGLDATTARARIRSRAADANSDDLLLLDDLLGIGDPNVALPQIDPDARRRRLTALLNSAALSRDSPALYVIEDAHWVDEVSESMIADFVAVLPQTASMMLITHRPEYQGALTRVPGAQTIALAPLRDSESAELIRELVGIDSSVDELAGTIAERAAGNPFFAEEIVRELAERGVLSGTPGAYESEADAAEVSVPATLQTTIAARIDRLDPAAKRTLSAAAVVGSRFAVDLLAVLGVAPEVDDLLAAQLIDQVSFTDQPEYVFHHPLIRAVAYESQLKSDRADLHRRLALAIEQRGSPDKDAAAIAEHLEAAGDVRAAYRCQMRAGTWSAARDIHAARASWERASRLADVLPGEDPDRTGMRIAPRLHLCTSSWRVGRITNTEFDDLRALCVEAGDELSLAIAMYGPVVALSFDHRHQEASALASEQFAMLEKDPGAAAAVGVVHGSVMAKLMAGDALEAYRLADWALDLVEGEPAGSTSSPLSSAFAMTLMWRGIAAMAIGLPRWRDDMRRSIAILRSRDAQGINLAIMTSVMYGICRTLDAVSSDDDAVKATFEAERIAIDCGDDIAVVLAQLTRGLVLSRRPEVPERDAGFELLCHASDYHRARNTLLSVAVMGDVEIVRMTADRGNLDEAIEQGRAIVDLLVEHGEFVTRSAAIAALVEVLLRRGSDTDIQEAHDQTEGLASLPTDPGFVLNEIQLLRMRALLAQAIGDDTKYRDFADRYLALAKSLGFEGHIARAEAMV